MKRKDFLHLCVFLSDVHFPTINNHAADIIISTTNINDLIERLLVQKLHCNWCRLSWFNISWYWISEVDPTHWVIRRRLSFLLRRNTSHWYPANFGRIWEKRWSPHCSDWQRFLETNPLFIDLVFHGFSADPFIWNAFCRHTIDKT